MKNKDKKDVVPLYSTLPLVQPDYKTKEAKATIPKDEDVKFTRGWCEDFKL